MKHVVFCGIDVHMESFYIAAYDPKTKDFIHIKTKACAARLMEKLKPLQKNATLKLCYEAGLKGFELHRTLTNHGFDNIVVSPLHIPRTPGKRVKTDRIDAQDLAKYYSKDMLTQVSVPEKEDEAIKDMLRARRYLVKQSVQIKNRITSLCTKIGFDYKAENCKVSYWTKMHRYWLNEKIEKLTVSADKFNLYILIRQLNDTLENIALYDEHIKEIAVQPSHEKQVTALKAFKGIDTQTALSLKVEIGDVKRFSHPKKLVSYAGLDIAEYSSGGRQKKFGITKMGNTQIRTQLVEACQFALFKPKISRALSARHSKCDEKTISISKKCMNRLYKKGSRLLYAGKHRNKVKTACAREMIGFIWEALQEAA